VVTISYFFFFIGSFLFYNSRYYRIRLRGWQTRIYKQAQYYIYGMFKGDKPPFPPNERRKFNPLQKTSYFYIMFLILPLIVFTGVGLLFPELIIDRVYRYNGVFLTAIVHAALGFILFVFLLIHIYASTIGYDPLANFRSMFSGWHEIHDHEDNTGAAQEDDEDDEDDQGVQQPGK
jgi:thiosulfate reductase cytochrome b subunit